MHIIQILYITASTASVCAGVPQLRQLMAARRSDEFSVQTWSVWTASQFAGLSYAIWMHDLFFTVVTAVWVVFYCIMMTLILKYRRSTSLSSADDVTLTGEA